MRSTDRSGRATKRNQPIAAKARTTRSSSRITPGATAAWFSPAGPSISGRRWIPCQCTVVGTGFAFAGHFGSADPAEAVAGYRESFEPSSRLSEPQVMLGVAAMTVFAGCGGSDDESDDESDDDFEDADGDRELSFEEVTAVHRRIFDEDETGAAGLYAAHERQARHSALAQRG